MDEPALLSRHVCSTFCTEEALKPAEPKWLLVCYRFQRLLRTCVRPLVIFQVSGGGEPFATVLLLADERLVAVVRAHVNLEPLQHVEALPAALGAAPEHPVVPWRRENPTRKSWRLLDWCIETSSRTFTDVRGQSSCVGVKSNTMLIIGGGKVSDAVAVRASGYLCVLRWYLRWAGQVNVLQQPSNEQRRICLGSGRPLWGARSPSPVGLCVWSPRQPEKEKWDRLCRKQLHEWQRATLRSLGRARDKHRVSAETCSSTTENTPKLAAVASPLHSLGLPFKSLKQGQFSVRLASSNAPLADGPPLKESNLMQAGGRSSYYTGSDNGVSFPQWEPVCCKHFI